MNLSIFIESEPGRGQDTAISGQNYAFVFDGLGGKGGKPRTNAVGERELEAKIASTVSAKALEKLLEDRLDQWSDLIQDECRRASAPDEIAAEITLVLNDALQAAAKEWNADTLPTTISGWLIFPLLDNTHYALAIWAGDSRCYTIDDHCMKLYTQDDTAENQRVDAMEELMLSGSPSISNRLGVDKEVRLNHTSLIVDHRTLLLTCSDGIYGYVPSPMHLEYYLRYLGMEDSVEQMVDEWNKFFLENNLLQDDSATLEGIYVGEHPDDLAGFKDMLLATFDDLEAKYINPFPQPPELKDSDELVRGIGIKLGKNETFRTVLAKNIRQYAEKGVRPPDGFPCTGFVAELREKQRKQIRLKKHSIEEQCKSTETELEQLIDTVRYHVPVLEDMVDYQQKKLVMSSFQQNPLESLHNTIQRLVNSLFCIYYNCYNKDYYRLKLKKREYESLNYFEIYDHELFCRGSCSNVSFGHLYYSVLTDAQKYKAACDLETALFNIRILTDEILDEYHPDDGKLTRAGTRKLRLDEQELTPEQKKELKQWLVEADDMDLKFCGVNLTLDLPTLDRLLKAAQRYQDAVNAKEDNADIFQEEIDRYVEENAAADAKYLARKWFENGRIESFELPAKLAASIQKLIDKVHDAKKSRLDAFDQYRRDRLELWKQYKPGFEAWNEESEMRSAAELGAQSENKGENEAGPCETKEEPKSGTESLDSPETQAETGSEELPSLKLWQEDAQVFDAPTGEEDEQDVTAGDEKDGPEFRPIDFEKVERERRY